MRSVVIESTTDPILVIKDISIMGYWNFQNRFITSGSFLCRDLILYPLPYLFTLIIVIKRFILDGPTVPFIRILGVSYYVGCIKSGI